MTLVVALCVEVVSHSGHIAPSVPLQVHCNPDKVFPTKVQISMDDLNANDCYSSVSSVIKLLIKKTVSSVFVCVLLPVTTFD